MLWILSFHLLKSASKMLDYHPVIMVTAIYLLKETKLYMERSEGARTPLLSQLPHMLAICSSCQSPNALHEPVGVCVAFSAHLKIKEKHETYKY